jgi:benzodiazapine receptor
MDTYTEFYNNLIKPDFFPPEWVFGLAWNIIYPLIAIAAIYMSYLIYKDSMSTKLVVLFIFNMIANVLFTPIQFVLQNNLFAFLDILIVVATLVFFEIIAWKESKILFVVLLPYLAWVIFAAVLQGIIVFLN